MKKIEYKSVIMAESDFVHCRLFNELGLDGWEFVDIIKKYETEKSFPDCLCLFKREIPVPLYP